MEKFARVGPRTQPIETPSVCIYRSPDGLLKDSICPPRKNELLRLYSMHFCPYAERTRMVLNCKKVEHEIVNINLSSKPSWFLEISPLGKVPVLQLGHKIMYESMITCDYLDEKYPNPPLYPSDPWDKAVDKGLIDAFESKAVNNFYKMYKILLAPEEIDEIAESIRCALEYFENELEKRATTFFFGDRPGMLDYVIFPWIERFPVLQNFYPGFNVLSVARFPKLSAYVEGMFKDEAALTSINSFVDQLEFFKSFLDGQRNYDIGVQKQGFF